MNINELIEQFRAGLSKGLDYELALSLAYLLGAWDRWELALKYCDIALSKNRLETHPTPPREGYFFKAVCLRMLFAATGLHYDEALALLDAAAALKEQLHLPPDARYVKEKATLLFYWDDAIQRTSRGRERSDWRAESAIELSHQALELSGEDLQLRAQVHNNLCFYYANWDPTRYQAEIRDNLKALEREMANSPVEQWPINFVDTALLARCRLYDESLDVHRWVNLRRVLEEALNSGRVRSSNVAAVRAHLAEAQEILAV